MRKVQYYQKDFEPVPTTWILLDGEVMLGDMWQTVLDIPLCDKETHSGLRGNAYMESTMYLLRIALCPQVAMELNPDH